MRPVHIRITDVLDLHTFRPAEVPDLLADYLAECVRLGFRSVRVIHGKGGGILKRRVHSVLRRDPQVRTFYDAPLEAGGWGATIVELTEPALDP